MVYTIKVIKKSVLLINKNLMNIIMPRTVRRRGKTKSRRKMKSKSRSKSKLNIDLKDYIVLNQTDVNLLYDITKKTIDILDKANIEYWATDGTLLGIIRSKGFIPWDDDVDIAIDIKDKAKLRSLKDVFKKANLDLVGVGKYMKVKPPSNKDVWIDIFILTNGGWPQQHFNRKDFRPEEKIFPLRKGKFGPFNMNIPNKSEIYLDRIFTDWKTIAYIYNHHTKGKKKVYFKANPELKKPTLPN